MHDVLNTCHVAVPATVTKALLDESHVIRPQAPLSKTTNVICAALALALNGTQNIHAIACDTDGVDGAAEVAVAVIGPYTPLGSLAARRLTNNDAHSYFAQVGEQVTTGPTLTNVNDFRAILILSSTRP